MREPNPLLMGAGGSKVQAQSLSLSFFFYFLFIHNFDYEFENLTVGLIRAIYSFVNKSNFITCKMHLNSPVTPKKLEFGNDFYCFQYILMDLPAP